MTRTALLLAAASLLASTAHAQMADAPTGTSKPQPTAIHDTIPPPEDKPYPGTLRLQVDATDTVQGIFRVKETVPVAAAGPMTLLYPKWLPGNHSPTGQITRFAGLVVKANGQVIPWTRDPVDVFAFHVDVPQGVSALDIAFHFLSPTDDDQGRIQMTPAMMSLQWDALALYPAGYFTRQIPIQASATYPAGWTSYTALRPSGAQTAAGGTVAYETVSFDTLVDSPTIAGAHARTIPLSPDVNLDVLADRADQLETTPEQIDAHKALVTQAVRLFGAQHYNHYDFLFTLSDRLGGEGLEHHRSSEDGTKGFYFTDWKTSVAMRDLLAHEFTHSWDGKFRRGADLWTPDYRTPMRDSLLWVYEGQTQFWGNVLAARSGLVPHDEAFDALAEVAAFYQNQGAKAWRPLVDTTNDPIIARRAPAPWPNYQGSEDYYRQGQLVWLDADSLIREKTGGRKSIDDFARAFFGMKDRDWGELTYTVEDVAATLNAVVPYDWMGFLKSHVYQVMPEAPLEWLARDGYRLVYTDKPGAIWEAREKFRKGTDLSYSIGLALTAKGEIGRVAWDSPAFKAGLTSGTAIVAVNGRAYDADGLKDAITAAKGGQPITLLVKVGDQFRTVGIPYTGGLRYPHLERTGKGPGALDQLYAPRTHG